MSTSNNVSAKGYTTEQILATAKKLQAQLNAVRKTIRARQLAGKPVHTAVCHVQIAARRLSDVRLFATRNIDHAEACCWEARTQVNLAENILVA